jgi:hypothetical protein
MAATATAGKRGVDRLDTYRLFGTVALIVILLATVAVAWVIWAHVVR